ncbi:MAG: DNA polymerase III subunit alpha [Candidatus Thorarchaeota archaeon]|nr:DNA polymerase III subunit alpha [Thermoplasmatales archaeon]
MKHRFSHLHVHSEYSILNGVSGIEKWYEAAEKRNIAAIAFTEWNNMGSSMASFLESEKYRQSIEQENVKAIFGIQILLVQDLDTSVQEDNIILLARNEKGYKNLLKLSKFSWTKGFDNSRQTARVNFEVLKKYRKGLYCLTGSLNGPVAVSLEAGYAVAEQAFLQLREIFKKRLLLEIQMNEFEEQKHLNKVLLKLSNKYGNRCVITNDCHFVNKGEDKLAHFVQQIERHSQKHIKKGRSEIGTQKWLKSLRQLDTIRRKLHGYITESTFSLLVDNTNAVADDCNVTIPVGKHHLPNYDVESHPLCKSGMKTSDELFEHVAKVGFKEKVLSREDITNKEKRKYKERFNFEMKFIKDEAKFSDYFMIIDDIVRFARANNIEVGEARGSVAGSLVAYCMVTNIDPLRFDLMFERFLNPARISGERAKSADALPDIDLDLERVRRPDVKQYIIDKYGKDRVCTIGTYQTMKLRSLIRDAQRIFEGELPVTDTKRIKFEDSNMHTLIRNLDKDKVEDIDEAIEKSEYFQKYYKRFPYLVDFYFRNLEGQIRAQSRHAAAVLVTPTDITDWIPVRTQKLVDEDERVLVSQWRDKHCERRGLLKLDILGIKTLNVFKFAKEMIKKIYDKEIIFTRDVDIDDKKVLRWFDKGKTEGVFQFNSKLQSQYLKELKVTSFEDLIATNAILRPGPMRMDSHKKYIDLSHGRIKPEYPHKLVKSYLKNTYGLVIYQEQCMRTANVLGKLTLSEADIMRTAMKKKDLDMMHQFEKKFVAGCRENGLSKEKAKTEWSKLEAFFKYGFNRCIHKDSMITLANGTQEKIIRLYNRFMAGEEIWIKSYDTERKEVVNHKVKEVVYTGRRRIGYLTLKSGQRLLLTSKHGVGTRRGFRIFSQLRIDDDVKVLLPGSFTKGIAKPVSSQTGVARIDPDKTYYEERFKEPVYDIVMEDNGPRNFFANNILVHNSHSASYAFNGFICQWLKVHYPLPFWTATLEFAADDEKKAENIWNFRTIVQQHGIEFEKPKASRTRSGFYATSKGKIAWPIRAIKGVGIKTAEAITKACKEHRPKTFAEFYEAVPRRQVNKRVMEKLIAADAFYNFGTPKKIAKQYYLELRKEKHIPEHFNVSKKNRTHWMDMKDSVLGYMEQPYRVRYKHFFSKKITPISWLEKVKEETPVITGGKVVRVFPYQTKRGRMYFVNVRDADGEFLLLILPGFYRKNKKAKKIKEGDIVEALGIRSVSNRGEIEVVLRDDRVSQLEVLEDT